MEVRGGGEFELKLGVGVVEGLVKKEGGWRMEDGRG